MIPEQPVARLVSSFDTIYLGHLEHLLQQSGILVEKRNFLLAGGAGELPVIDVTPELWVAVADYEQARAIIEALSREDQAHGPEPWECPRCHELIEGQFVQCWHCGYFLADAQQDNEG
jgi:hypothetical protein